jgi:release factor glutamine methyltransferase
MSECAKKYGLKIGEIVKIMRSMVAKIKNISPNTLIFSPEKVFLDSREIRILENMLLRYQEGEPPSKIINCRAFWNHDFFVNEAVLDPRPETETIMQMILARFSPISPLRFLDLGTGSGCLLLSLLSEFSNAVGLGLDLSSEAIRVAIHNQKKLGIEKASFLNIDWNSFSGYERFDVIVGNPPYVKTSHISQLEKGVRNYDPILSLDGGESGLRAYEEISRLAGGWLLPHGVIFLEVGGDQASAVGKILQKNGFKIEKIEKDTNGLERAICATL